MVDADGDGKTGLEENDDKDEKTEKTVFDELKNLALVGEGAANRLTFVDITEPHNAKVVGRMPSQTPVYRAAVLPGGYGPCCRRRLRTGGGSHPRQP